MQRCVTDLIAWVVVAALVASLAGLSAARLVEAGLDAALDAALGQPGEFDVLVQVRQESAAEAEAELAALAARELGRAAVKRGPAAAGSAALLVDLPTRLESAETFARLDRTLAGVPGFTAWVPLVEPSVVVQGVHPALRPQLQRRAAALAGVRFAFAHGGDVIVVLDRPSRLPQALSALKGWLDGYRVFRVNAPQAEPAQAVADRARQAVGRLSGVGVVHAGPAGASGGPLAVWPQRVRQLVLSYATTARVRPLREASRLPLRVGETVTVGSMAARVVEAGPEGALAVVLDDPPPGAIPDGALEVRRNGEPVGLASLSGGRVELERALARAEALMGRLGHLGEQAAGAVSRVEQTSRELQHALARLKDLSAAVGGLAGGVGAGRTDASDALLALALSVLLGRHDRAQARPAPSEGPAPGEPGPAAGLGSLERLERDIGQLERQLSALSTRDVPSALQAVRGLRRQLPSLRGDEAAELLQLLDRLPPPERASGAVELVVRGAPPPSAAAVRRALASGGEPEGGAGAGLAGGVRVYAEPAGTVSPGPRAVVLNLVDRARAAVGAMAAAFVIAYTLLNDWALVTASLWAVRRGLSSRRLAPLERRLRAAGWAVGASMGALSAPLAVPGGGPVVWASLVAAGGLLGWLSARLAGRLAAVDADAVEAALAFGLDAHRILKDVTVPSGRPWLLAWLWRPRSGTVPGARRGRARLGVTDGRWVGTTPEGPGMNRAAADGVRLTCQPAGGLGVASGTAGASGPWALEAVGLERRFGEHRALAGFSLKVRAGETVALMGPSGSGKSTALRCLSGLWEPDAGQVRVFGEDLWSAPEPRRRALCGRMAMVFQRPQLVGHLRVLDNVALPLLAEGQDPHRARQAARECLALVGLEGLADRLPGELSGGEGQRVAIARALVRRPDIILWDEPTAHLDAVRVADLLALVQELVQRLRTTMLIVTHEARFARRVAHRIAVVEAGRVVEEGPAPTVLERPRTAVACRLAALAAM